MAVTDSSLEALFQSRLQALDAVSLVDAIVDRRSRRFALGNELEAGPLTYRSTHRAGSSDGGGGGLHRLRRFRVHRVRAR